jgi:hypothetical protein
MLFTAQNTIKSPQFCSKISVIYSLYTFCMHAYNSQKFHVAFVVLEVYD